MDLSDPSAGNVLQPETALISTIKTLADNLNPHVLHKKYAVEKLSLKQIAEEFASSKAGILAALQRAGIPTREPGSNHGQPGNPPYGKRLLKGQLSDHPAKQKVIRLIQKMASERLGRRAIAKRLSEMNIETRKGHTRWHHEMVTQILKRNGLNKK